MSKKGRDGRVKGQKLSETLGWKVENTEMKDVRT